jgi:hypothetical protein
MTAVIMNKMPCGSIACCHLPSLPQAPVTAAVTSGARIGSRPGGRDDIASRGFTAGIRQRTTANYRRADNAPEVRLPMRSASSPRGGRRNG